MQLSGISRFGWYTHHLLSPLDPRSFFSEQWQREPCHLQRAHGHNDVLEAAKVGEILAEEGFDPRHIRLGKSGELAPLAAFAVDRPLGRGELHDPKALIHAFESGHTIVIDDVSRRWRTWRRYCAGLEHETGHPFQANLYISPHQGAAFQPHEDDHDVFVLQLGGEKRWQLAQFEGVPAQEVVTKAGDCLYIPAGCVHSASAWGTSIHATVGLVGVTYADILRRALTDMIAENQGLEEYVPAGFHAGEVVNWDAVATVVSRQLDRRRLGATAANLCEHFAASAPSRAHDAAETLAELENGDFENHQFMCSSQYITTLRKGSDKAVLTVKGTQIELPVTVAPLLEEIMNATEPFTPASLRNASPGDSRGLWSILVRVGLVELAAHSTRP